MNTETVTLIANISQILGAVVAIIAIPIVVSQLRESIRLRHLEALARVFDEFQNDASSADRRYIYSRNAFDYYSCTSEERSRIERVIQGFNKISFLAEKGLIPKELVIEGYSFPFVACWQRLELYIRKRRSVTKSSDWAAQFEQMAALCQKYRIEKLGETVDSYGISEAKIASLKNAS